MTEVLTIPGDVIIKKRGNSVTRVLEGKAILLVKESQRPFRLNEVGTKIWEWMDTPRQKTELIELMCAVYQTEKSDATSDLDSFLAELYLKNLIETDH
jgi:hypothetical protein